MMREQSVMEDVHEPVASWTHEPDRGDERSGRWAGLRQGTPLVGVFVLALLLYRPWLSLPFTIVDFSEFMPIMRASDSFADALANVSGYFAEHGRSALITYLFIVVNWVTFGDYAPGWDVLRFAIMFLNAGLCFVLLRRTGLTTGAALFGAALLVVAPPAAAAWIRLTGEMLAVTALLVVVFLALQYQTTSHWRTHGLAIAVLAAFIILAKEPLVTCIPAVLALACAPVPPAFQPRQLLSPRNRWVTGLTILLLIPVAAIVLQTAAAASDGGYIASYSEEPALTRLLSSYFGFLSGLAPTRGRIGAACLAALAVLAVGGWYLRFRRAPVRQHAYAAAFLLAVPLLGALIYLPWPRIEAFYALPFFLCGVVLLSAGFSELERGSRVQRVGAYVSALLLVLVFTGISFGSARQADARRELNGEIVAHIARGASGTSLVVATRWHAPQAWQGAAATFRRAVLDSGLEADRLPAAADVDCGQLRRLPPEFVDRIILVSFSFECGSLLEHDATAARTFSWFDFSRLRFSTFDLRADVRFPRVTAPPAADG